MKDYEICLIASITAFILTGITYYLAGRIDNALEITVILILTIMGILSAVIAFFFVWPPTTPGVNP